MDKLNIDHEQLKRLVSKICRDITISGWRPDYVVGLTRGGLTPAVMISHYFGVPCETLKVSLRDGGEPESNLWMAEDAFEGRNILVVDDINDTGATIDWIIKDWPRGIYAEEEYWNAIWHNNVRFAVLIDNLSSRCSIEVDYSGTEINKTQQDVWVDFFWESWWLK